MSRFIIKIDSPLFQRDLKKVVQNKIFPKVLRAAIKGSKKKLIDAFMEAIGRTMALRGIFDEYSGDLDKDVRAHLGLDEDIQSRIHGEIHEAVRQSLVSTDVMKRGRYIGFDIVFENLIELIGGIPSGTYDSINKEGDSTSIPWMDWLLRGGGVSASIMFSEELDDFQSRSGRAIMLEKAPFGAWDIDDYDKFAENDNFVFDALEDTQFVEDAYNIIVTAIANQFDRLK